MSQKSFVHQRRVNFPVYRGSRDQVVGIVSVKAIYANLAAGVGVELKNLIMPPLVVPETQNVLQLVETFKHSGKHIAMVTDEFGNIVGLVTLNDVMEAVVGEFPTDDERAKPEAKKRDDGSWLIDAMIEIEAVERALPGFKLCLKNRSSRLSPRPHPRPRGTVRSALLSGCNPHQTPILSATTPLSRSRASNPTMCV